MHFELFLVSLFGILGLLIGSLSAVLWRKRHFYIYSVLGLLIGGGAAWYFTWYAEAYDRLPLWTLWAAYFFCGLMVAEIMALVPVAVLALLSLIWRIQPFLARLGLFVMGVSLIIGVYGAVDGNTRERVERYDIYVKDLPAAFEGYRIAQMTDTHIGPYFRYTDLPGEFDRAKREGAKVVFFTGDLIDDVRYMPETAKTITEKSALFPDGIFYVWGNHEYYRNKPLIEDYLRQTPVTMLVNQNKALTRGGTKLYVAGVDYPWSRGAEAKEEREHMVEEAYAGIPAGAPSILLAHHSDFITEGFERGAFLTLTGHTHGTQFGLFGKPIITPFAFTRGMYSDGIHQGYVSRGDASWFPFRFSCARELAIFTLHKG